MSDASPSLRARRRAETQRAIQAHAMRLFTGKGYDATTVNEIADAAGVSPMTLYRHFPTKEDLVLVDQIGQLIAERIAAGPVDGSLIDRIGRALVEAARTITASDDELLLARLRLMIATPALRARHLDNQLAIQQTIVDAVLAGDTDPEADPEAEADTDTEAGFRAWAAAGACLAALYVALMRWANEDGRPDLADLLTTALAAAFDASPSRWR